MDEELALTMQQRFEALPMREKRETTMRLMTRLYRWTPQRGGVPYPTSTELAQLRDEDFPGIVWSDVNDPTSWEPSWGESIVARVRAEQDHLNALRYMLLKQGEGIFPRLTRWQRVRRWIAADLDHLSSVIGGWAMRIDV